VQTQKGGKNKRKRKKGERIGRKGEDKEKCELKV
jgi:hypothetical protein